MQHRGLQKLTQIVLCTASLDSSSQLIFRLNLSFKLKFKWSATKVCFCVSLKPNASAKMSLKPKLRPNFGFEPKLNWTIQF